MKKIKTLTIYILAIFYLNVGITHFTNPNFFLVIMPPYLHFQEFFVYLSGLFEALFGFMIIFKKTRFYGAWGIFLLLIAVYPANIYLYSSYEAQEILSITKEGSFIRLFYQIPLLILSYWHSLEKSSYKMDIFASAIFFPTIIYFLTLSN